MTRDEVVASLYQCFNASSADSDINIVRIHHLLDVVEETERIHCGFLSENPKWSQVRGLVEAMRIETLEKAAKVCEIYWGKIEGLGEDDYYTGQGRASLELAKAIRSMK